MRLQPLQDFSSLREVLVPKDAKVERVPARREVKQQNEEAMAALKTMLGGVQGAPMSRKRHR